MHKNAPTSTSGPKIKEAGQTSRRRLKCTRKQQILYALVVGAVILIGIIIIYMMAKGWEKKYPTKNSRIQSTPQIVVILVHGLGWDTLERIPTEDLFGFRYFKEKGIRVEYVTPVFPGLKFPSWTTLQTGMFPEAHGIVGNVMYDRTLGEFDCRSKSFRNSFWWQQVEPIWITATKAKRRVAALEWNNADVPFRGRLPLVAKGYSFSRQPFDERIQDVIDNLEGGMDLILMSYDGVDNASETFGPNSQQVRDELRGVAKGLQDLFEHVHVEDLQNVVQVVVLSDRGYERSCPAPRALEMEENVRELMNPGDLETLLEDQALRLVYAKPGRALHLLKQLRRARGYVVRHRRDLPYELHYKGGRWAPDILLYPSTEDACLIRKQHGVFAQEAAEAAARQGEPAPFPAFAVPIDPLNTAPTPTAPALLLAWGSAFGGAGLVHPPLRLVDVYQVLAQLMRVIPRSHNGSWAAVQGFMGENRLLPWIADASNQIPELPPEYLTERRRFTDLWDKAFAELRQRDARRRQKEREEEEEEE